MLADAHGNVIHLGERDCTIQRRHQKLVEETPSPAVDAELRGRIGAIAVEAARAVGLPLRRDDRGPARSGRRLLLHGDEHAHPGRAHRHGDGTGLDLVREQVLIAAGEPLWLSQEDVRLTGHAIECRINAEDPSSGFLPDAREDHGLPRAGGAGGAGGLGRRRTARRSRRSTTR